MSEPNWLPPQAVVATHAELAAEHGGLSGLPWEEGMKAALGRPGHVLAIRGPPLSLAHLAAAYGFSVVRNRCFPDGNEGVALALVDVFLQLNGIELTATEAEAAETLLALAHGELTEGVLANWIAARSTRL